MHHTDHFAPDRWEVTADADTTCAPPAQKQRSQVRRGDRFLKGPVPWPWLQRAMTLPGKALAVGLMLWLKRGITGRHTVHFCLAHAEAEGISQKASRCAIRCLETAGLILVQRQPGRGVEVTLLTTPESG